MIEKRSRKIVHLPTTVGGNPQGISSSMKSLDLESVSWSATQNYLKYKVDYIISENDNILIKELKKLFALRYIIKFDIVFFNFAQMIFKPHLDFEYRKFAVKYWPFIYLYCIYNRILARTEIFLLKVFKKKLIMQFQGDDIRQGDICLKNFEISPAQSVEKYYYGLRTDKMKRKMIKFYEKHCDLIYYLNPDLKIVLGPKAKFLPYCHIDLNDWTPRFDKSNRRLKIGHAPSNRGFKGTDDILKVIKELKDEGYQFEFVLIENVSHDEAKEIYKTLDIMIDQLYAGWYGGLAVELMALAVPVLCYIRESDLKHIPDNMAEDLPVINVNSETIFKTLKNLILSDRKELNEIGKNSRAYVEKYHDPIIVTKSIINDFENNSIL